MRKSVLVKVVFVLCILAFAASIVASLHVSDKFYLFNQNTEKLYRYFLLEPGESYHKNISDADSIVVYTRILKPSSDTKTYEYQIKTSKYQDNITKKINISKSTKAVSGDKVSSYNSYKYYTLPSDKDVLIKNTGSQKLLVKISVPGSSGKVKEVEFISYPPDYYNETYSVNISDKNYTYYDAGTNGIEFQLEGPAVLKVISRLIVDKVDDLSYSWEAEMDGSIFNTAEAVSPYSGSSLSDGTSIVTKGVTHELEIPAGIHKIKIRNVEPEAILYRFYLKK